MDLNWWNLIFIDWNIFCQPQRSTRKVATESEAGPNNEEEEEEEEKEQNKLLSQGNNGFRKVP